VGHVGKNAHAVAERAANILLAGGPVVIGETDAGQESPTPPVSLPLPAGRWQHVARLDVFARMTDDAATR